MSNEFDNKLDSLNIAKSSLAEILEKDENIRKSFEDLLMLSHQAGQNVLMRRSAKEVEDWFFTACLKVQIDTILRCIAVSDSEAVDSFLNRYKMYVTEKMRNY